MTKRELFKRATKLFRPSTCSTFFPGGDNEHGFGPGDTRFCAHCGDLEYRHIIKLLVSSCWWKE